MIGSRNGFWTGPLVGAVLALACATPKASPRIEPGREPIRIEAGETSPILVEKMILRLPAGTVYGGVYTRQRPRKPIQELVHTSKHTETEEFNILLTDRMNELGYRAVDPTEAVFTPDSTVKTRFRLVGVITDLRVDTFRDFHSPERSYQTADLEMEVRLYDARVKDVVYAGSFRGEGRAEGTTPVALPQAVLSAVEGALSDERFVERVTGDGALASEDGDPVRIPACPHADRRLPADVTSVAQAVVTVRQGGATGSGVLISPDGHVLTAAHLLSADQSPRVGLRNLVEFEAVVERVDPLADVALLRIPGTGHACVPLAGAAHAAVGADVFAIGVPLDERLAGSVTRGIVSGRPTIDGQELLQTDASINLGNSGGPVLSSDGRVLGIISSKFFGPGIEGVGFAVPADVIRGSLGIQGD